MRLLRVYVISHVDYIYIIWGPSWMTMREDKFQCFWFLKMKKKITIFFYFFIFLRMKKNIVWSYSDITWPYTWYICEVVNQRYSIGEENIIWWLMISAPYDSNTFPNNSNGSGGRTSRWFSSWKFGLSWIIPGSNSRSTLSVLYS